MRIFHNSQRKSETGISVEMHLILMFGRSVQWSICSSKQRGSGNDLFIFLRKSAKYVIKYTISRESQFYCTTYFPKNASVFLEEMPLAKLFSLFWDTVVSDKTWKMPVLCLKSIFLFFFTVTTLKNSKLRQLFSFTLPAMITASSVKHMLAEKSVGESITEAKGRRYTEYHNFLCQVMLFFKQCWINVIIAPAKISGQCSILVIIKVQMHFFWHCFFTFVV